MEHKIKVILADDHQLVRKGFAALLGSIDFVELLGEAANGREALDLIRRGLRPDVALLDYEMPLLNGLETLEQIKKDYFGVKVIILTMLNNRELIQLAMDKGANGFLFKNATLQELTDAIRRVAQGETYVASEVALSLLKPAPLAGSDTLAQLTERELEILRLVAQGFSSTEIGEQLFISPRTVDTHRNNLIQKLDVRGIAGLVHFAIKNKLV